MERPRSATLVLGEPFRSPVVAITAAIGIPALAALLGLLVSVQPDHRRLFLDYHPGAGTNYLDPIH